MGIVIDQILEDKGFKDINPVICGVEECAKGHSFGPYMRRYYLIHYVLSGKGKYYRGGREYSLKAGQFFLIYPDEITTYTADTKEPWTYVWVGFTGALSKRFDTLTQPVGELPMSIFSELLKMIKDDFPGWQGMREEYIACVVHKISAALFAPKKADHKHAKRVKTFIEASFMNEITVQSIADGMFLDRRYLSRLFKREYGVSIKEFLTDVRLQNAARFLSEGFSVNESYEMSGFKDRSNFSKMFRRKYGTPPSEYGKGFKG